MTTTSFRAGHAARSLGGWTLGLLLVLAAFGCSPHPVQDLRKIVRRRPTGPQIPATVITLRTTIQPSNRVTVTRIVVADDVARATEEIGQWRLFDLKENRVAFVNEFGKTYRYESFDAMRDRYDDAGTAPFNEKVPRAEFAPTNNRRDILGVAAKESVVRLGGYQRQMWFAAHPLIPARLFALMHVSRPPGPEAPATKRVDDALVAARGFPLADHTELPYANTKIVIDREVVSVERKNVEASLVEIPDDYTEVKPAPRPRPRPVAPPPPPAQTQTTATTETTATTATTETTATMAPPPAKKAEPETKKEPEKRAVTRKAVTKKTITKKPAAKKPEVKKAPEKKAPAKKSATTKKPTTKKSTTKKPATAKTKKSS